MGIFFNDPRPRPAPMGPRPMSPRPAPKQTGFLKSLLAPAPKKDPAPSQSSGLFGSKKHITRSEFRQALKNDRKGVIPKTMRRFNERQRLDFEKNFSWKEYGNLISQGDVSAKLNKMNKLRMQSRSFSEKKRIQDQMDYLKKLKEGK